MARTEDEVKGQQAYANGTLTTPRVTKRSSLAVESIEADGYDMSRAGKRFCFSGGVVANAQVPVVERPTTTAKYALYNGNGDGGAVYVIDLVAAVMASGTAGLGAGLLIGVTSTVQAEAVSNGTGVVLGNPSGNTVATTNAKFGNAITLAAAPSWICVGSLDQAASVSIGSGIVAGPDVLRGMFIVRPRCCLGIVVLAPTGTTAKFTCDVMWHEVAETPEG